MTQEQIDQITEINEITLKDGRRVWLFGCTLVVLMLVAYMAAILILATSTVPRIPKEATQAYVVCMQNAKDAAVQKTCIHPAKQTTTSISAKILDAGPYPWVVVAIVFLFCGVFYLMQSREDWQRTRELAGIGAAAYSKNAKLPDFVSVEVVQQVGQKILDYVSTEKTAMPANPQVESVTDATNNQVKTT